MNWAIEHSRRERNVSRLAKAPVENSKWTYAALSAAYTTVTLTDRKLIWDNIKMENQAKKRKRNYFH